jgi:choline dehydrogenase-like flavoprotein
VDFRVSGEQLLSLGSYVECTPTGPAPWPVTVRGALAAEDQALLDAQRDHCQEPWDAVAACADSSARRLPFEDFDRAGRTNAVQLPEHLGAVDGHPVTSSVLGGEDHEGGTLPLGTVLDDRHRLAGIAGFYVADPATFPRMGAANPGLTTMALARRLSACVIADGQNVP